MIAEKNLFYLTWAVNIYTILTSIIHEGYQNRNCQSKIEVIAAVAR